MVVVNFKARSSFLLKRTTRHSRTIYLQAVKFCNVGHCQPVLYLLENIRLLSHPQIFIKLKGTNLWRSAVISGEDDNRRIFPFHIYPTKKCIFVSQIERIFLNSAFCIFFLIIFVCFYKLFSKFVFMLTI